MIVSINMFMMMMIMMMMSELSVLVIMMMTTTTTTKTMLMRFNCFVCDDGAHQLFNDGDDADDDDDVDEDDDEDADDDGDYDHRARKCAGIVPRPTSIKQSLCRGPGGRSSSPRRSGRQLH